MRVKRPPPTAIATALLSGVAGVAGSYLVAGPSSAFVGTPVGSLVVDLAPGAVVTLSITTLGDLATVLAFGTALALVAFLYAVVSLSAISLGHRSEVPYSAAILAGVGGWALTAAITGAPGAAIGPAVAMLAAVGLAGIGVPRARPFEPARRRVLELAVGVVALGGLAYYDRRDERDPGTAELDLGASARDEVDSLLAAADESSLGVPGLEPLVSDGFYEVDINSVNPRVDTGEWALSVTGAVDEERTYTFEDLRDMGTVHAFNTLRCVGESLNGRKMDNALWTGVPVARLLADVAVGSDCECVMLRAEDGYYEEFPLAALERGVLAYGMNGRALPRGHGYPVRALIPGHWGEINVKWLTEIEFLERETKGYWERRGWHGTGPVNTVAKLHLVDRLDGGRVRVGGHAYAGTRGISAVEVSTDGGDSWRRAALSDPLPGEDVWRQWAIELELERETEVTARALEADGTIQPRERSRAFPSGPTGWVSRTISPSP